MREREHRSSGMEGERERKGGGGRERVRLSLTGRRGREI
jgi:hypothetical protein